MPTASQPPLVLTGPSSSTPQPMSVPAPRAERAPGLPAAGADHPVDQLLRSPGPGCGRRRRGSAAPAVPSSFAILGIAAGPRTGHNDEWHDIALDSWSGRAWGERRGSHLPAIAL